MVYARYWRMYDGGAYSAESDDADMYAAFDADYAGATANDGDADEMMQTILMLRLMMTRVRMIVLVTLSAEDGVAWLALTIMMRADAHDNIDGCGQR